MFAKTPRPIPKQLATRPHAAKASFILPSSTRLHLRPRTHARERYRSSSCWFLVPFEGLLEANYADIFFGTRWYCSNQVRGVSGFSEMVVFLSPNLFYFSVFEIFELSTSESVKYLLKLKNARARYGIFFARNILFLEIFFREPVGKGTKGRWVKARAHSQATVGKGTCPFTDEKKLSTGGM